MKTIKLTEESYEILSTIKWLSQSKTFSDTIKLMDEQIKICTSPDNIVNRGEIKRNKYDKSKK